MSNQGAVLRSEVEAAAQQEIKAIADELAGACERLLAIHQSVPISPREGVMLVGEEDMDVATTLRCVIEVVVNDSLKPVVRDLRAAAAYRVEGKEEGR